MAAGELPLGEYTLHIFVQDLGALDVGSDKSVDIGVEINGFGKYSDAKIYQNITTDSELYIGEHFFAVKSYTVREELESEEFEVRILKRGLLDRIAGSTLGVVKMNVCQIYFEKDRMIQHKWFVLQNRDDPKLFQKVQGYVKLSMTLSHSKDPKNNLEPETSEQQAKSRQGWNVEIPASISLRTNQLTINLIKGMNLPRLDAIGSGIDPYAQFTLGAVDLKSKCGDGVTPTWNQTIMMPVFVPSCIKNLLMQVWDYDLGRSDEPVGSVSFGLDKIMKAEYREPRWVHLYGAPLKVEDKDQINYMHQYPQHGKLRLTSSQLLQRVCFVVDLVPRRSQGCCVGSLQPNTRHSDCWWTG